MLAWERLLGAENALVHALACYKEYRQNDTEKCSSPMTEGQLQALQVSASRALLHSGRSLGVPEQSFVVAQQKTEHDAMKVLMNHLEAAWSEAVSQPTTFVIFVDLILASKFSLALSPSLY